MSFLGLLSKKHFEYQLLKDRDFCMKNKLKISKDIIIFTAIYCCELNVDSYPAELVNNGM